MFTENSLDDILEKYTSEAEVRALNNERKFFEKEPKNRSGLKNYPAAQRELDLHGLTSSEAQSLAENFLVSAVRQRLRTVRLIVGKGLHSKDQQAVLPGVIEKLLSDWKRQKKILGYKWEKGRGTVLVYLP